MDSSKIIGVSVAVLAAALGIGLAYYLPGNIAKPIDKIADDVIVYETGENVDIYAMEQRLTGSVTAKPLAKTESGK